MSCTPAQEAAVQDDETTKNSTLSDFGFFAATDPNHLRRDDHIQTATTRPATPVAPAAQITTSPSMCSGCPAAKSNWGPQERALGHGFAGLPVDNVGVQYGLAALRAGTISPAQFVDLNAKLGGVDPETIAPIPGRNSGRLVRARRRLPQRHDQ